MVPIISSAVYLLATDSMLFLFIYFPYVPMRWLWWGVDRGYSDVISIIDSVGFEKYNPFRNMS
jgi:hypothetical protein